MLNRLFQKKSKQGGVEDVLFWTPHPLEFVIFLPLKIPDKTKPYPCRICHKTVLDLLEIPSPKTKTPGPGNSTLSFLGHPLGIPLRFSLTPRNSACYFFDTPWNSISSTHLPVWIFSRIAQCWLRVNKKATKLTTYETFYLWEVWEVLQETEVSWNSRETSWWIML